MIDALIILGALGTAGVLWWAASEAVSASRIGRPGIVREERDGAAQAASMRFEAGCLVIASPLPLMIAIILGL